jgi:hypothetical protein
MRDFATIGYNEPLFKVNKNSNEVIALRKQHYNNLPFNIRKNHGTILELVENYRKL